MNYTTTEKLQQYQRGNEDALVELIELYSPIINKYARYFGREMYEDVQQELRIAVIEAAKSIKYIEQEGKCINYIVRTIKHRFVTLYKKQYEYNEREELTDEVDGSLQVDFYKDVEIYIDIQQFCKQFNGRQQAIIKGIMMYGYGDTELARNLGVTRQYINRVKKKLFVKMQQVFFGHC